MAKLELKYLNVFQDAKGRWRYRIRKKGMKPTYVAGNPDESSIDAQPDTFWREYRKLVGAPVATKQPGEKGTIAALIAEYRRSPAYTRKLGARTRQEYDRYLDRIQAEYGNRAVAKLDGAAIERIRDKLAATHPRVADWYVQLFKILCRFAVRRKYRLDNPASDVELIGKQKSYDPWEQNVIDEVFEAADPNENLALLLLLYTGQRRGAVAKMTWHDYDGTMIACEPDKGGEAVWVPCHSVLKEALDKAPRRGVTILVSSRNKSMNSNSLGLWISGVIDRAGYAKKVQVHGLRANAASRLADAGCSENEIMAITGHKTPKMVQHYTRGRDRKKLAHAAIVKLEAHDRKAAGH